MPTLNPSITGIVAVGQVPFTNLDHRSGPSVVLGDNDFKWYAASKRLGIGLDSAVVTPMAKVDIRGDSAPANWPVALAVESTTSFVGEVFVGDPALSTYISGEAVAIEFALPALSARKRGIRYAGATLTALAGGELVDVGIAPASVQFGTGTLLALQEGVLITGPTYSATSAKTITEGATLSITAPVKGANVSWGGVSPSSAGVWAIKTQGAGGAHFTISGVDGYRPGAALDFCFFPGAAINLPSGTEYCACIGGVDTSSDTITWAGAPDATQRWMRLTGPVLASTGVNTITTAATLAILSAPANGTNITITNPLALWIQAGISRFDGISEFATVRTSSAAVPFEVVQRTATTGSPTAFKVTGASHTTLSNAEASDVLFSLARTVQFGQNTLLATQRAIQILAPTYSSNTATKTITDAVTLDVNAAPVQGTNVTLTNAYALRVQAGETRLLGGLRVTGNMGFYGVAAVGQATGGQNLTNNVTTGGTDGTIANYTDLTIYANDAAAIRNDIYQLARALKQDHDQLRALGILS